MERKRDVPILGETLRQMMNELRQKSIDAATVPYGIMPLRSYTPKSQYPLKRDAKGRMMKAERVI
jgi:hypothetical protein